MSNALPTDASLDDINHATQSVTKSDAHDDIHSAVVGGDFAASERGPI